MINSHKDFPPSWQNNSREIAKQAEEAFDRCPCDYHKNKLENIGYTVDFSAKDYGEEPIHSQPYEGDITDEELAEVL